MPRALSSTTPSAVRRNGKSWPALAYSIAPLSGSRSNARQVTNIAFGMSWQSRSLTCASTAPGEVSSGAVEVSAYVAPRAAPTAFATVGPTAIGPPNNVLVSTVDLTVSR